MSEVLYQKYRPKKFSELFGQQHIKISLSHQIASENVSHAYLFCGPRAVGKTTVARLLAKAINCEKRKEGEFEPCNGCSSCNNINQGNALDIIEIDAASHTGVDNVRENIIASARVSPSKNKYKVFIIDEVHMLSISAFNALLKTLEEPPKNIVFVLATTEIHKVPGTIISRCQRYDFKKISSDELIEKLNYIVAQEGREVEQKVLKNIAIQAEGCLRDAESLLGQILFLDDKRITEETADLIMPRSDFNLIAEFTEYIFVKDIEKALHFINKLPQEGVDLRRFAKDLIEFLRKLILVKIGGGLDYFSIEFDEETEKRLLKIAETSDLKKITGITNLFLEAQNNFKRTSIETLPLEMAVLKACLQPAQAGKNVEQKLEIRNWELAKNEEEVVEGIGRIGQLGKEREKLEIEKLEKKIGDGIIKKVDAAQEVNVPLREIQRRWDEVIEETKKNNPSFCFVLKVSKPVALNGNVLKVASSHEFHAKKLQDVKNNGTITKILQKIFNCALLVESIVDSSLAAESGNERETVRDGEVGKTFKEEENGTQESGLFQDVLSEFGGEVVE